MCQRRQRVCCARLRGQKFLTGVILWALIAPHPSWGDVLCSSLFQSVAAIDLLRAAPNLGASGLVNGRHVELIHAMPKLATDLVSLARSLAVQLPTARVNYHRDSELNRMEDRIIYALRLLREQSPRLTGSVAVEIARLGRGSALFRLSLREMLSRIAREDAGSVRDYVNLAATDREYLESLRNRHNIDFSYNTHKMLAQVAQSRQFHADPDQLGLLIGTWVRGQLDNLIRNLEYNEIGEVEAIDLFRRGRAMAEVAAEYFTLIGDPDFAHQFENLRASYMSLVGRYKQALHFDLTAPMGRYVHRLDRVYRTPLMSDPDRRSTFDPGPPRTSYVRGGETAQD